MSRMRSKTPLLLIFLTCLPAFGADPNADTSVAGNDQVAEIIRTFGGRGALSDNTPPTPPSESVKQFKVREGFEIELMAAEPDVTQPLFLSWDSRGRLWAVQYRQYQFPAGLKILRYDQHLRAVFDKVPEAPPKGARGADKITVFEDTNGDGLYDTHKDVITGLNIATSVQTGHGGIWVLNPPYLLFYPDKNADDVPDGDPEVHLSGFGLEDTHSVANSLMWGPDGWLYAANGSTTTGNVSSAVTKNVKFQGQCIWRYHPDTKVFEIYAEGGGNTFSTEIDAVGRVFSGTNGGTTRGMYYPQGSYGVKGWGKHGPLTNPYAFGYFEHMKHEGDNRRFAQAFCIYEGGLYPKEYDGKVVGPNSLQNVVWISARLNDTSTYRTVDEPNLIESPDRWFRPVYGGVGPDGCVYLGDWYDTRLSHVRPVDDWHKTSGRVYRIKPKGSTPAYTEGDLAKKSSAELIALFENPNKFIRRRAVLELGWRGDKSVDGQLAELVSANAGQKSLEALWALNLLGGVTKERAQTWLSHPDEHIRRWVVRILGDRHEAVDGLVEMATRETAVQVRSQLASAAKRLPAETGVAIVRRLVAHTEDLEDHHMPLMNWWALEAHAESGWAQVETMVRNPEFWQLPMVRKQIASRLTQRYAMAGGKENLERCASLLQVATDDEVRAQMIVGLNRAFQGITITEPLPPALAAALDEYQKSQGNSGLVLALRQGKKEAIKDAVKLVGDSSADLVERIEVIKALGEIAAPEAIDALIKQVNNAGEHSLQRVAMQALTRFDDSRVPKTILAAYNSSLPAEHDVRATADRTMASRPLWAKLYLGEIDRWFIRAKEVPADVVQQLRVYDDPEIKALVEKHFGKAGTVSSPEKLAFMAQIKTVLTGGKGSPEPGRVLFTQRCAVCHKMFEEGGAIGPDLTPYERGNLDFWIPGIVDPSLEIREEFQSFIAQTKDGRVLAGMIAAQNPETVTFRDAANQTTVLSRANLAKLEAIPMSLMPEGMLTGLTDEQLRDLFAYLTLAAKP